ncbi:hypothetical protein KI387_033470, partial [Taxus chinensis]
KRLGIHSEFEIPTNQLVKPTNSQLKEKLIPTTKLEISNPSEDIPVLKSETNVIKLVSLGTTTKIVELLEKYLPILLPFDSM